MMITALRAAPSAERWPLPELARCDFCAERFRPARHAQRTCAACQDRGAPDQSVEHGRRYDQALAAWRERGES